MPESVAGERGEMTIVHGIRASALLLGLISANRWSGRFLLPANSCWMLPATIVKAGSSFEFVDIREETLELDWDQALAKLRRDREEFSGLIYIRPYGAALPVDDRFREVKEIDPDLIVIDDRCQMAPSVVTNPSVADVALFSTGATKVVDLGWGGLAQLGPGVAYQRREVPFAPAAESALATQIEEATEARSRLDGIDGAWLDASEPGTELAEYVNEISAKTAGALEHKARLNEIYSRSLPVEIQLPSGYHDWRFNIMVPAKDELLRRIFDAGLFASGHYPSLAGVLSDDIAPAAEALHGRVVNLFNDHRFSELQATEVCDVIVSHLAEHPT
jgi:hypothetical protein